MWKIIFKYIEYLFIYYHLNCHIFVSVVEPAPVRMPPVHVKRKQWTDEEKAAVNEHLSTFITLGKCPGKKSVMLAKQNARLNGRTWQMIKFYIKNKIDGQKNVT